MDPGQAEQPVWSGSSLLPPCSGAPAQPDIPSGQWRTVGQLQFDNVSSYVTIMWPQDEWDSEEEQVDNSGSTLTCYVGGVASLVAVGADLLRKPTLFRLRNAIQYGDLMF